MGRRRRGCCDVRARYKIPQRFIAANMSPFTWWRLLHVTDLINWRFVGKNLQLSEDFIHRFSDFLDWEDVTRYQVLSESFILEHAAKCIGGIHDITFDTQPTHFDDARTIFRIVDKLYATPHALERCWLNVLRFQRLNNEFITFFDNRLNECHWHILMYFQNLDPSTICSGRIPPNVDWFFACRHQLIPEEYIRTLYPEVFGGIEWENVAYNRKCDCSDCMMILLTHRGDLSAEFIWDILSWCRILLQDNDGPRLLMSSDWENPLTVVQTRFELSDACITTYADILDWFLIVRHQHLNEDLIIRFLEDIPMDLLACHGRNRYYTLPFLQRFKRYQFGRKYIYIWAANTIRDAWAKHRYAPSGWGYWRAIRSFEKDYVI